MSIAWSGIVLLVLLLPGFLFFIGLYFPEKFTREVVERSPLGQLAGSVLIAFVVHGVLYLLNAGLCGARLPCIDLTRVLDAIALDSAKNPDAIPSVAASLSSFPGWIFFYVLLASTLGVLAGWGTGTLVVKGPLRVLVQHRWVYDLKVDDGDVLTVAYVLSRVSHEKNHLLYRGFLKAFGLQKDGRFSYLILTNVVRYYMCLEEGKPVTTTSDKWIVIGETSGHGDAVHPGPSHGRRRDRSYFNIDGSDIANVIFDRYEFPFENAKKAEAIISRAEKEHAEAVPAAKSGGTDARVVKSPSQKSRQKPPSPSTD